MKKLIATITTIIIALTTQAATCFAADLAPQMFDLDIIQQQNESELNPYLPELSYYKTLPEVSLYQAFTTIIKTLLFLASSLVVIGLLVVGAMYLTGAGEEENITKAKKILGYLGIGILIMSISYAVVTGILQLEIF